MGNFYATKIGGKHGDSHRYDTNAATTQARTAASPFSSLPGGNTGNCRRKDEKEKSVTQRREETKAQREKDKSVTQRLQDTKTQS